MESGYELIRRLASGGMGEVFVARRLGAGNFEKRVALKLLLPHLTESPQLVARFHAEARLAARMHHPNIVEIFDVGEVEGRPFLAMQLVEGVSLRQVIKELAARQERLSLPLVRLVGTGICEALGYAHALTDGRGRPLELVHRDVTPSNILLSGAGAVLLTDFGIAHVQSRDHHTDPGTLLGKVAYLAPEQLRYNVKVDARADLYAAGLTLYELLTGQNPFRQPSTQGSMEAVMTRDPVPLRALRPDVTPGMAQAIHRVLSRVPGDRFPTARAFREALVDGPVATGPELAAEIQRLCGALLSVQDTEGPGTASVVLTVTPTHHREEQTLVHDFEKPERLENTFVPAPIDEDHEASTAVPVAQHRPARWAVTVLGVVVVVTVGTAWRLSRTEPAAPAAVPNVALAAGDAGAPDVDGDAALALAPPEDLRGVDAGWEDAGAAVAASADDEPEEPPRDAGLHQPVAAPDLRPPARPPRSHFGYLTADAFPWAEVWEGERLLDRTPFVRLRLPVGRHALVFRNAAGQRVRRTIWVKEGETTKVRVDF